MAITFGLDTKFLNGALGTGYTLDDIPRVRDDKVVRVSKAVPVERFVAERLEGSNGLLLQDMQQKLYADALAKTTPSSFTPNDNPYGTLR